MNEQLYYDSATFTDAKILECSEAEYRSHSGFSYSQWKLWDQPEYFEGLYVLSPPTYEYDETADMLLGTNIHSQFLEGKQCQQVPDCYLTSNGQRRGKLWEAYRDSHLAIECLNAKEMATVKGLRDSILSQPKIASLLWGEGSSEVKIAAKHEASGLSVRGMLDKVRWHDGEYLIADMKISAIDPTHSFGVSKRIYDFRYYMQAAAYVDLATAVYGMPPLDYLFIWCHKEPPYLVRALPLNPRAIELGRQHNDEALVEIARRLESGDWYGEGHNEVTETVIDVPRYAYENNTPIPYEEFLSI